MLFDKVFGYTDAMVAEVNGVIYVGGQGYKADTLERIEGKRLANMKQRGLNARSPVITNRIIQENLAVGFGAGSTVTTGDAVSTDLINSDPSLRSSIRHSSGNALVTGTYNSANYAQIVKATIGDTDQLTEMVGVPAVTLGNFGYGTRLAAMIAVGANTYDFLADSDPFQSYGYYNSSFFSNGIAGLHIKQGATDVYSGALYKQPGQSILDMDATGFLIPNDRYASPDQRVRQATRLSPLALTNTAINLGTVNYPVANGPNNTTWSDAIVAVPAFTDGAKRRFYYLNVRATSSASYPPKALRVEYTDVASIPVTGAGVATDIKLNGFTLKSSVTACTPYVYVIRGQAGKNYIVIFFTKQNGYAKGDWLVLEENGPGDLTVVAQGDDERFGAMRAVLATSANNDEWLISGLDGVYRWSFDYATKSPKVTATVFDLPIAGLGLDSFGRTWIVERLASTTAFDSNNIHLLPQAGVTAFASAQFEATSYNYSQAAISTNVLVKLTDLNQNIIAGRMRVTLEGKCTFLDGSVSKDINTTAGVVTKVPVLITGAGSVGVTGGS